MAQTLQIYSTYICPATNALMDLGSLSLQWNNLYIDGTAYLDNLIMEGNIDLSTHNLVTDTITGTKIGTSITQKLGFFNATPIIQPGNTDSLETILSDLGFRASGIAAPLAIGTLTIADTKNIVLSTGTGTKIGTSTSQKLAFYNAAPVAQQTGLNIQFTTITYTEPAIPDYSIQDFTQTSPWGFASHDEANSVLRALANLQVRMGQLETRLITYGLLGAAVSSSSSSSSSSRSSSSSSSSSSSLSSSSSSSSSSNSV